MMANTLIMLPSTGGWKTICAGSGVPVGTGVKSGIGVAPGSLVADSVGEGEGSAEGASVGFPLRLFCPSMSSTFNTSLSVWSLELLTGSFCCSSG